MPILIELPDNFFTPDQHQKLTELFTTIGHQDFSSAITKVVRAALREYREMFLGMGLPSRADEIQQHRLFFLIKEFFEGRLPTEAEVSSMFQLTQTKSRSLIQFVKARFHYDLEQERKATLISTIQSAQLHGDSGKYRVVIQSDNVLEELNRIISMIAPSLDPLTRVKDMSRTFVISEDSYNALIHHLGI